MVFTRLIHRPPRTAARSSCGSMRAFGRAAASRADALALAVCCALAAAGAASAPAGALAAEAAVQARRDYAIPAGRLSDALARFAAAAGVPLSFDPQMLAGLRSAGLAGSYSVGEGFARLLAGSGYELVDTGGGRYSLRRAPSPRGEAVTLAPVTVSAAAGPAAGDLPAERPGGQTARGGRAGMLGNVDAMDLPFSLSSYTEAFLRNQRATTVADALAYDPSVAVSQTGGMVDSYSIRGFPMAEGNVGEMAFNGVYGIAPNYRTFTSYVERVEVLKGATGLLYGMSPDGGVGGVINIVPKRAGDEPLTRLAASYGMRSMAGAQLDLGRRFGPDGKFGLRLNGSHEQGDTAVDHQHRRISAGALALDYRGERLKASLDLVLQGEKWDAPSRVYSVAPGVDVPSAPDGRTNPVQKWGWSDLDDRSALLDVQYQAADRLALFASAGHGYSKVRRLFDQQMVFSDDAGDFSATPRYALFEVERNTANAGVRGAFDTGPLAHELTLQASALEVTNYQNSRDGTTLSSNLYRPVRYPAQDIAAPDGLPRVSRSWLTSLALSDTLSLLDGGVKVIAGVRYQRVESDNWDRVTGQRTSRYRKGAYTPSLGLVVHATDNAMVYASYIEGLSKGDVAPDTASNAGEMFSPYRSRQYEVGFKVDYGSLNATVSAFQLTRPSGQLNAGVFGVDGRQRNRGLELAVQGEVSQGLRVLAGATWLDAELTRSADPLVRGNRPVGVPRLHAALGVEWDAPWLPGLTLTSGVVHVASQYVDQQNRARLPAWTRVDVGARYATAIQGRDVTFQLNLQNAFDRGYWSGVSQWGAFALGAPRTLTLSASMAF